MKIFVFMLVSWLIYQPLLARAVDSLDVKETIKIDAGNGGNVIKSGGSVKGLKIKSGDIKLDIKSSIYTSDKINRNSLNLDVNTQSTDFKTKIATTSNSVEVEVEGGVEQQIQSLSTDKKEESNQRVENSSGLDSQSDSKLEGGQNKSKGEDNQKYSENQVGEVETGFNLFYLIKDFFQRLWLKLVFFKLGQ